MTGISTGGADEPKKILLVMVGLTISLVFIRLLRAASRPFL